MQSPESKPGTPTTERKKHFEFKTCSEEMTIAKFLKQHGTSLPVLLKVSQGYESFLDKYSFGKDQLFVALEKKEVHLVTFKHPRTKQIYEIPLDEELVVSPVLPDCFADEGIPSPLSSKELLGCSTLPRTFCAMKPFKDSKGHLVEQGTLLFTLKEGNPLVAITQGNVKICIDKSTLGEFSVRSSNTEMSLKEAVNNLKLPFTCRLFAASEVDCYVHTLTVEKVIRGIVLKGMITEEGHTISSFQRPSIIPASLQILVSIMKTKEIETLENIYENAAKIYTNLKPSHLQHSREYQPLISHTSDTKMSHRSKKACTITSRPLPHVPLAVDSTAGSSSSLGRTLSPIGRIPVANERLYDSADAILPPTIARTTKTNLKPKFLPRTSNPQDDDDIFDYSYVNMSGVDTQSNSKHKNIDGLKKLTVNEILLLLEKMNLTQYRDAFEQEQIDGIFLSSLDNEMLEEIGVTKRIHKMRLKRIIEGEQSVEEFN